MLYCLYKKKRNTNISFDIVGLKNINVQLKTIIKHKIVFGLYM